jgi:hypothetical protein
MVRRAHPATLSFLCGLCAFAGDIPILLVAALPPCAPWVTSYTLNASTVSRAKSSSKFNFCLISPCSNR